MSYLYDGIKLGHVTTATDSKTGHTDIYAKTDGNVYIRNGAVEQAVLLAIEGATSGNPDFNSVQVGAGYASATPVDNSIIVQDKVGIGTSTPQANLDLAGSKAYEHTHVSAYPYTVPISLFGLSFSNSGKVLLPDLGTDQHLAFELKNISGVQTIGCVNTATSIDGQTDVNSEIYTLDGRACMVVYWGGSGYQIRYYYNGTIT